MSDLTDRVVETVESIPAGRVMTYGDVAHEARTGARAVGRVLHGGGHEIPWWRVVNADGRPYPDAAQDAHAHFIDEETPLVHDNDDLRVNLARASWHPQPCPSPAGPSRELGDQAPQENE